MAQKLHTDYGFSYDTLKVLLGGWNTWKSLNETDPAGYPVSTGPNPAVFTSSTLLAGCLPGMVGKR